MSTKSQYKRREKLTILIIYNVIFNILCARVKLQNALWQMTLFLYRQLENIFVINFQKINSFKIDLNHILMATLNLPKLHLYQKKGKNSDKLQLHNAHQLEKKFFQNSNKNHDITYRYLQNYKIYNMINTNYKIFQSTINIFSALCTNFSLLHLLSAF